MPRAAITLRPRAPTEYNPNYHTKLRGALWEGLGDEYDARHNAPFPSGLGFSPIHPYEDPLQPDEQYTVVIGAYEDQLLEEVIVHLNEIDQFNVGDMAFDITNISSHRVDVGSPGTHGCLRLESGLYLELPDEVCDQYGIEPHPSPEGTYWREGDGQRAVLRAIETSLQTRWETVHTQFKDRPPAEIPPGPDEVDALLFDGGTLRKTYWVDFQPVPTTTKKVLLSKWAFDYTVRDGLHRQHLNLGLTLGLGQRTDYGFGFPTITVKQTPTLGAALSDTASDGDTSSPTEGDD